MVGLWCVVTAVAGRAEDWDRFRGPNGTGVVDATTVPTHWTDADYIWKVQLPGIGHSSPVVWGQHVYVTCADQAASARRLVCLNTRDGSVMWQRDYALGTITQHPDNGYASATPAADSRGVVLTWASNDAVMLLAVDHAGEERWRRDLGPFIGPHGAGASPIIVEDLVVLASEQEDYKVLARILGRDDDSGPTGESFLVAVDRATGATRWKVPRKSTLAAYSTPCVHRPEGGAPEIIFTSTSHGITAVDVATGRVTWEVPDIFEDRCVGSPIVAESLVIATYGHGTVGNLCVAVRPGSAEPPRAPAIVYHVTRSVPLVPTPVATGGRLFLWTDAGIVSCLDLATGDPVWRERVAGDYFGSPICIGERLYCVTKEGDVVVLAAAGPFRELGRVSLGEPSFATPAVADGVLYLRTASHLYALGGKSPD
jgi:outer membrane protein assembly factor BamB